MNNLKIGTRVAAGFAITTLLTAILGILSYSQISNINKASEEVTGNTLPSVIVISEIKANVESQQAFMLRHALSTDADKKAELEKQIADVRARNAVLFQKYE